MSEPVTTTTTTTTESRSVPVLVATVILTVSSTVVVALRLYTRCILLKKAGADDWSMLVAQLFAISTGLCTSLETRFGLGRHLASLSAESLRLSLIFLYGTIFSYNIGLNVVKISFLLQYRRIFPGLAVRRICLWGLGFVGLWLVLQTLLLGISCIPLGILVPSTESWCLDTLPMWLLSSIVNLITDFAIFLIPIPSIRELPIPRKQKTILFGIFGLGFCVCIISIIRVPTLRAAASATDPTWDNISAAIWTVAEFNAAIICSSLPVLRPLVFKVTDQFSSSGRKVGTNSTKKNRSGIVLTDIKSNSNKEDVYKMGPHESSDELVTATYDETIYGLPTRPSTNAAPRRPSAVFAGSENSDAADMRIKGFTGSSA